MDQEEFKKFRIRYEREFHNLMKQEERELNFCEGALAFKIRDCEKHECVDLPYRYLDFYCSYLISQNKEGFKEWTDKYSKGCKFELFWNIVETIQQNDLDINSLRKITQRTKIFSSDEDSSFGFYCGEIERGTFRIDVPQESILKDCPYFRDIGLFHEVAHLFYEPLFCESLRWKRVQEKEFFFEWKSRKWRSDPILLKSMLFALGFPIVPYDKISTEANLKSLQLSLWDIPEDIIQKMETWFEPPNFYYPELPSDYP
jgi:hypothetical protein